MVMTLAHHRVGGFDAVVAGAHLTHLGVPHTLV